MWLTVSVVALSGRGKLDNPWWMSRNADFLPSQLVAYAANGNMYWPGAHPFYFPDAVGDMPGTDTFYLPAVNMTNGTTDQFLIEWDYKIQYRCFGSDTHDGALGWTSSGSSELGLRPLFFSTEPGAQLPDIEATVNSCSEHNANNSAAVRVTDMEMTHGPGHRDTKGKDPGRVRCWRPSSRPSAFSSRPPRTLPPTSTRKCWTRHVATRGTGRSLLRCVRII